MATPRTTPMLSLRDLEVRFTVGRRLIGRPKTLHAVNKLSLDVERGEFVSIVGESGCGKSTLVKTLLGLQAPTAGAIAVNGRDLSDYSRLELAHLVQPIFQDPYSSLNPRKSVAANIALPLILSERPLPEQVTERVREIMRRVGLPQRFENSYPSQMSGGQRQRVAIARALITRPKILVCDEPTSALDVSVQAQILNLLRELSRDLDLTCVFISHDLSVVRRLSQRVAVMYLGRIVEIGASEQIFQTPHHPYTRLLISSILPPDPEHHLPPARWDGGGPDPTNMPEGCHFRSRCVSPQPVCATRLPELVDYEGTRVACLAYEPGATWKPQSTPC